LSKTKRGKSDKDREKGDRAITSNVDKGIADSGSANASVEQGETSRGNACERKEKRENTLDSELRMMPSLNERGWLISLSLLSGERLCRREQRPVQVDACVDTALDV
jgi:hypothetical protein